MASPFRASDPPVPTEHDDGIWLVRIDIPECVTPDERVAAGSMWQCGCGRAWTLFGDPMRGYYWQPVKLAKPL